MPVTDLKSRYIPQGVGDLPQPTLHAIALTVAWATTYADPEPLDEKHEQWPHYFAYREWFRQRIAIRIRLSLDTPWETLYHKLGVLLESAYSSTKEHAEAFAFGERNFLTDYVAPLMFQEFEEIKYRITNRH